MSSSSPVWVATNAITTTLFNYDLNKVGFIIGTTPLSTFTSVAASIATYYLVIFGGREIMRNREPFKLQTLTKYHNLMLTVISGVLLALILEQIVPQLWSHGVSYNACGNGGWTPALETIYFFNYITKYIEFADTVLLMLKKKPLTFLHTYHHGATAFLCYSQLLGHTPVSWVPITLNLAVHVLMYNYYYLSACGKRAWYKEYITILQIIQFIIDIGFIYWGSYHMFAMRFWPNGPGKNSTCAISLREMRAPMNDVELMRGEIAAAIGIACITSYLFLFIAFYFATYKKPAGKKAPSALASNAKKVELQIKTQAEKLGSTIPKILSPVI